MCLSVYFSVLVKPGLVIIGSVAAVSALLLIAAIVIAAIGIYHYRKRTGEREKTERLSADASFSVHPLTFTTLTEILSLVSISAKPSESESE